MIWILLVLFFGNLNKNEELTLVQEIQLSRFAPPLKRWVRETPSPRFQSWECFGENHAVYISVIQIAQKPESDLAEINIKVFTDDLQSALRNEFPDYKPVSESVLCEERREFILPYFSNHFSIEINNTKELLAFKNCQQEGEVYWLKFEVNCPASPQNMKIEADFFMELFPTQSNVLSLEIGGEKRYCRMTKGNSECEAEL